MNISKIEDIIQDIDLTNSQYSKFNLIIRNVNLPFGITERSGRYIAFVSLCENKLLNDELYVNLTQLDNKIKSLNPKPEKLKCHQILRGANLDHFSIRFLPQSKIFDQTQSRISKYDVPHNVNVHLCLMFSYFRLSDVFGYSMSVIQMKINTPPRQLIFDSIFEKDIKIDHHKFVCDICYLEKEYSIVCVNGHNTVCLDCFSNWEHKICPICRGKILSNE